MFFFFNDTATTEIYTLSLHDALPICRRRKDVGVAQPLVELLVGHVHFVRVRLVLAEVERERDHPDVGPLQHAGGEARDRKSTRLNSSHANISYAVFCLKKKKHND